MGIEIQEGPKLKMRRITNKAFAMKNIYTVATTF
jgi:hypothetical protein